MHGQNLPNEWTSSTAVKQKPLLLKIKRYESRFFVDLSLGSANDKKNSSFKLHVINSLSVSLNGDDCPTFDWSCVSWEWLYIDSLTRDNENISTVDYYLVLVTIAYRFDIDILWSQLIGTGEFEYFLHNRFRNFTTASIYWTHLTSAKHLQQCVSRGALGH